MSPTFHPFIPKTALGKVLLQVVNRVWVSGNIPVEWNVAWVVSILKKGDPKLMDNYRGISLISVVLKLVTLMVTIRLQRKLEERQWFIPEQAGFRTLEECAAHACSLYEILVRRQSRNKRSYVAFIDFRKAYDTVPHEALFRKLELMGVDGRMLRYFRNLYESAGVRVRSGDGLSETIPLLRGLRQGCNASPLLFDIFINDILSDCQGLGVEVLGLDPEKRQVGLLYADDLVLIGKSRSQLKETLRRIEEWAVRNCMSFGVQKCGVMGVGQGAHERVCGDVDGWYLQGERLPLVESYTYLGLVFDKELSLDVMAADRARKGTRTLHGIQYVLRCQSIPIKIRVDTLLKAVLIPVLTYGGELWGMSQKRAEGAEKVLSRACKSLLRLSAKSSLVSPAALGLEFNVAPITALVCAARTRALLKFPRLRSTISLLLANVPKCKKRTWVTGSLMWLKRFCPGALGEGLHAEDGARVVKTAVWRRWVVAKGGRTARRFRDRGMVTSNCYLSVGTRLPQFANALQWLCRFRLGAFWTAHRLAVIKYLPPRYLTVCPCCEGVLAKGESIEHLLVDCPRWESLRRDYHLRDILLHVGAGWKALLGGSVNGGGGDREGTLSWCPRTMDFLPNLSLQPGVARDGVVPVFVYVACFLHKVVQLRIGILRHLMRIPRADANHGIGRAGLANGRSPPPRRNHAERPLLGPLGCGDVSGSLQ